MNNPQEQLDRLEEQLAALRRTEYQGHKVYDEEDGQTYTEYEVDNAYSDPIMATRLLVEKIQLRHEMSGSGRCKIITEERAKEIIERKDTNISRKATITPELIKKPDTRVKSTSEMVVFVQVNETSVTPETS